MSHSELHHDPEFDFDTLRAKLAEWKSEGTAQVNFEWGTGKCPTVVYYPAGVRSFAQVWRLSVPPTGYSEVYADWLEERLAPQLISAAQRVGMTAKVLCVDQQPILVMRQRRREIERASHPVPSSGQMAGLQIEEDASV
jgi:hypothetical protein